MKEFRKKQKSLFKIMRFLIIFTAVYIFVFIGIKPVAENYSNMLALVLNYVSQIFVLVTLVLIFVYYNRYGKCDSFLERTESEINDYAYYFLARNEQSEDEFCEKLSDDLKSFGFSVSKNSVLDELEFDIVALKRKEYFYCVRVEAASRNDVLAYLDAVINDITVHKLKRTGNAVLCLVTDNAQDDAIAISKMITPLGKKEQLKVAIAIVEPQSRKCFFLGNMETKCQQMILSYIMKSKSPVPEELKGERHLPFQDELDEKMKSFTVKAFKDGTFYIH